MNQAYILEKEDLREIIRNEIQSVFESFEQKPPPKKTYISRMEAAKIIGVSLPTLWKFDKSGDLKPFKIGGKVLYDTDQIEEFIRRSKKQS